MFVIPECVSARLATPALVRMAVRRALIVAAQDGVTFAPGFGHGTRPDHRFSMKAGAAPADGLVGVKIGSYWPSNDLAGRPRHSSTICLIDDNTGRVHAVIEGSAANALRTAAAHALAVEALVSAPRGNDGSAPDAGKVMAVFGAGHQAFHEVMAVQAVCPVARVLVVNRTADRSAALVARLADHGIAAQPAQAEAACRAADLIATVTAARAPLFEADWVRPGTFVASMGSDGPGKQELPLDLVRHARLVADWPTQSIRVGEFQHIAAEEPSVVDRIIALGSLLAAPPATQPIGSQADRPPTVIFDSSGLALQDLFLGQALLDAALAEGSAVEIAS